MNATALAALLAALTPEERAAPDVVPRPGIWVGEEGADLRALTQAQTDALVRCELARRTDYHPELMKAFGGGGEVILADQRIANVQRGGRASELLVRALARRMWGDRDERWFERRGVRAGDVVRTLAIPDSRHDAAIAAAWPSEVPFGEARHDARPGERVRVLEALGGDSQWIVSDRPRDWMAQPATTGLVADDRDARYSARRTIIALDLPALCKRFDLDRIDVHRDESSRQTLFRADRNGVVCEIAVSDVDASRAGEAERSLIASLESYARRFPRFN